MRGRQLDGNVVVVVVVVEVVVEVVVDVVDVDVVRLEHF
jgi:hypothetical protein